MSKRKYKNPVHRSLHDYNWDGSYDDYDYEGPHRLTRNTIEGKLGGVCAGIGDYLGWDHTLVRIVTILLIVFTSGTPLLIYFILWAVMPKDQRAPYIREYREQRTARQQVEAPIGTAESKTTYTDVKSKFRSVEVRLQDLERSITSKEWKLRRDFRDLEG